jgi:uroporphyrinogen decarboxylase
MDALTSRARVETALRHEEPDRVPLGMSLTIDAYTRLRAHLGLEIDPNPQIDRFAEVRPRLDLIDRLGIDLTYVRLKGISYEAPQPRTPGNYVDEWGLEQGRVELPGGSHLTEVMYSPLADQPVQEIDLDQYPWPDPDDPRRTAGLEEEVRRLFEQTDLALMGRFGGPILETAFGLRGYQQWMMDLVDEPEFAVALLERVADVMIRLDAAGIRAAGRYLSVLRVSGEDLGMQNRPLFSPPVWRDIIRPVLSRRWRAAKAALREVAPSAKLLLHSDGSFRPFIPDLIEDGIEALDPMQVHLPGMDAIGLKRDFGAALTFHGGIDTQAVLPFQTPSQVARETERCIAALGSGGGLILGPVHNVQPDVPPENIVAMVETMHRRGRYPVRS